MVPSKLAEKDVERLPSAGLKTRLMQEALFFEERYRLLKQCWEMCQVTPGHSEKCLLGDGTSKSTIILFSNNNNKSQAIIL